MSWTALGSDPAPGDVGAVRAMAGRFGTVGDRAEELLGRLRTVDAGVGPTVWKGPAADAFRDLLARTGPGLTGLATSYREAHDAVLAYAAELDRAQQDARRAESDGEHAIADRDDARRRQAAARSEVVTETARRAAAGLRVAEAEALLLGVSALGDPVYATSLHDYSASQRSVQAHAENRAAQAGGRASAAGRDASEAERRLADAKARGRRAGEDVNRAAQAFSDRMERAGDASGVPLSLAQRLVRDARGSAGWRLGPTQEETLEFLGDVLKGGKDGLLPLLSGSASGSSALYKWGGSSADKTADWGLQFLGMEGEASGTIGLLPDGSYGGHLAASGALIAGRLTGTKRFGSGSMSGEATGTAQVVARADGKADVRVDKRGASADFGADAFAGGEITARMSGTQGPVKESLGVSGQIGIGATLRGKAGFHDGKLSLGAKGGLAFGWGAKIDASTEIDVGAIAGGAVHGAAGAGKKIGNLTHLL